MLEEGAIGGSAGNGLANPLLAVDREARHTTLSCSTDAAKAGVVCFFGFPTLSMDYSWPGRPEFDSNWVKFSYVRS